MATSGFSKNFQDRFANASVSVKAKIVIITKSARLSGSATRMAKLRRQRA